jgi:hypothetical protein
MCVPIIACCGVVMLQNVVPTLGCYTFRGLENQKTTSLKSDLPNSTLQSPRVYEGTDIYILLKDTTNLQPAVN